MKADLKANLNTFMVRSPVSLVGPQWVSQVLLALKMELLSEGGGRGRVNRLRWKWSRTEGTRGTRLGESTAAGVFCSISVQQLSKAIFLASHFSTELEEAAVWSMDLHENQCGQPKHEIDAAGWLAGQEWKLEREGGRERRERRRGRRWGRGVRRSLPEWAGFLLSRATWGRPGHGIVGGETEGWTKFTWSRKEATKVGPTGGLEIFFHTEGERFRLKLRVISAVFKLNTTKVQQCPQSRSVFSSGSFGTAETKAAHVGSVLFFYQVQPLERYKQINSAQLHMSKPHRIWNKEI